MPELNFKDLQESSDSGDSVEEIEISCASRDDSSFDHTNKSGSKESSQRHIKIPTALSPFLLPPPFDDHSFWTPNIPDDVHLSFRHYILGLIAPCFLGSPCSIYRKKDYIHFFLSFTLWLTVLLIFMFLLSIAIGGMTHISNNWTLGPPTQTLYMMGAKSAYLIKQGHIYRLITPVFLQGGLVQLAFIVIIHFLFLIAWERHWIVFRILLLYVLCSIGGFLLSCVVLPDVISVGATVPMIGFVGAKISRTLLLWPKLIFQQRLANILLSIILTICCLLITFSKNVDWASHIGALVTGILVGLTLWVNHVKNKFLRIIIFIFGVFSSLIYFISLILVFYLVTPVKEPIF